MNKVKRISTNQLGIKAIGLKVNYFIKKFQQSVKITALFFLLISHSCFIKINAQTNKTIKVACIGNSITYGAGIKNRLKDSYPAQLGELLGKNWEVHNFGLSGGTLLTKGDYPYINDGNYKKALAYKPDIVIIKLGTNDSKPQNWKFKDDFTEDYLNLVKSFKTLESKPKIYLCKIVPAFSKNHPINEKIIKAEINPLIEKIAQREKLFLIDLYTPFIGKKSLFPDKIHPNSKGATIMAKTIYKNIVGNEGDMLGHEFPGIKSKWKGFDRYNFSFENKQAFIVVPFKKSDSKQWVWRARYPNWHSEMDEILLKEGFYIVYVSTANQYGSPKAMKTWDNFYDYLTGSYGFSKKVVLEGVSRGGLFIYSWAKLHPERINCICAEAPVCDFKSWPAGFGNGKKSKPDWKLLKEEYGFKTDKEAKAYQNNPIDNLEKLANAKVPIIHMVGLNDKVVPPDENTFVLVNRYMKLGGPAYVIPCVEGKHKLFGHHFSIESPKLAADFIKYHCHLAKKKLNSKEYQSLRDGLKNCRIKFERTKKGRVAFLGGSITYNRGWRNMVCDYLKESFPDTEFEFIEAGIPSMGSTPGAFRLNRDVISKGKVDLLFEEAAVNDAANGRTNKEQIRAMEGIVRNARKNNPEINIILMHFVDPSKMEKYRLAKVPKVITNHESVARHYKIPSINLAKEVTDRIDAGEFSWEKDFKNLHPSPFGQKLYFNSIKTLLESAWFGYVADDDKITMHTLPEKLDEYCYSNGELITPDKTLVNIGWEYIPNWIPKSRESTRTNYTKVPMLVSTDTESVLQFGFTGSAVGIAIAAGPDAGIIEYNVDNGEWKQKDLFTDWSAHLHLPWYKILEDELKYEEHILRIRMSKNKNMNSKGNVCRIRYFFVNK